MKFTEALERFYNDRSLSFTAQEEEGFKYLLRADGNGFFILLEQGLIDIGIPWFMFEMDWQEEAK